MDHGCKGSIFLGARFAWRFIAVSIVASLPHVAFAQGGETEVTKRMQENSPQAAMTPFDTTPVETAQTPVPPSAHTPAPAHAASSKPSPVGVNGGWQAKTAQPKRQTAPVAPIQESDQAILAKVNDYFNKVTNIEGTFIQTDPDNTQKQGRFYFARPGRLRFDYAPPSHMKIISDGYYLAIEDSALNTSDKYPLEMTPFRLLLSETVDLARDANILRIDQGPDVVVVSVEDKKGDSSGRISLFFNRADMSLKQWIITDAQGLDTRIQVSDVEMNKRVSAELFEFSKDVGFQRE